MKKNKYWIVILIGLFAMAISAFVIFKPVYTKKILVEQMDLGLKCLSEMNYEGAITCFSKVIEIEPMNSTAYVKLAEAYALLGNPKQAIAVLEEGKERTGAEEIIEFLKEFSPLVLVTLNSGNYEGEQAIGISIAGVSSDVRIYYTLNGRDPKESGTLYEKPFSLNIGEYQLRAVAESKYGTFGDEATRIYHIEAKKIKLTEEETEYLRRLYELAKQYEVDEIFNVIDESIDSISFSRLISAGQDFVVFYFDGTNAVLDGRDFTEGLVVREDLSGVHSRSYYYGGVSEGKPDGEGIKYQKIKAEDSEYSEYWKRVWREGALEGYGYLKTISFSNVYYNTITYEGEWREGLLGVGMWMQELIRSDKEYDKVVAKFDGEFKNKKTYDGKYSITYYYKGNEPHSFTYHLKEGRCSNPVSYSDERKSYGVDCDESGRHSYSSEWTTKEKAGIRYFGTSGIFSIN